MAPSRLSLKDRISSPLEAGTSVAGGHHLPAHLNPAFEYVSKRLSRKGASVTLLVLQRDYQIPISPSPLPSPSSPFDLPSPRETPISPHQCSAPATAASTPSRPTFGLGRLIRAYSSNGDSQIRERVLSSPFEQFRNGCPSPAISEASAASGSSGWTAYTAASTLSRRLRWPTSPTSLSVPMTPATPFSMVSSSGTASTETSSAVSGSILPNLGRSGIQLVHTGSLCPRDARILDETIKKMVKKFGLEGEVFPQVVAPTTVDLPTDVIHRSLVQYETLFTSENLALLSLDHVYTFRTALQSYTRTQDSSQLEDAVDELRRLFLANGRKKVLKSTLLAGYRWLDPVSDDSLSQVCRMYNRAYDGLDLETDVATGREHTQPWPFDGSENPNMHGLDTGNLGLHRMPLSPPPQHCFDEPAIQPPHHPPPIITRTATPLLEQWDISAEEKDVLFYSELDDDELDELPEDLAAELKELDAIEAWYRDVQIKVDVDLRIPANFDISLPPPPPPPPIVHIRHSTIAPAAVVVVEDDSEIEEDNDDAAHWEDRRATPKMASPPPPVIPSPPAGVVRPTVRTTAPSMSLRLQTTFDTEPGTKGGKLSPPQSSGDVLRRQGIVMTSPTSESHDEEEDEEEESLTARPKSAIVNHQAMQWNTTAGLQSIDDIMNGGQCSTAAIYDDRCNQLQLDQQHHVGPVTPNGYGDISPITRGEWGFFINGGEISKNKALRMGAVVEMC